LWAVSETAASRPVLDRLLADVASLLIQAVIVSKTPIGSPALNCCA
jgi:hypothetical protein